MKRIALVALAFALTPVAGLAQDAPPPGPPPGIDAAMGAPNPQMMAAMRATHEQLHQLHAQTRVQMLAGLTAQHRAQLATLIGQFAISANPDHETLARQIDALLSRGEAQNIVNLAGNERTASHTLMQAARAQFESSLTPDQLSKMKEHEAKMESMRAEHAGTERAVDPGRELLHELLGGGHGEPGMHGGPGGPGGPGMDHQ